MTKTYHETLAILSAAASKDLESATAIEAAALESLTNDDGPYDLADDPTVADLLGYARRAAGSCEHAVELRAALGRL